MRPQKAASILLGVFIASSPALAKLPAPPDCMILATLFNEPFDDEAQVPVVPITFDARIAIRAIVKEVVHGACPFSPGGRVVFLIHSPSLTLGGYWFHDKDFFLTLQPTTERDSGRVWDLVGVDWPIETASPMSKPLLCSGSDYVVRAVVGTPTRIMLGPLTVFRGRLPIASISTIDVARNHPRQGALKFAIDYSGEPSGRHLKPRFSFTAAGGKGQLLLGSDQISLTCEWPIDEQSPANSAAPADQKAPLSGR